MSNSTAFSWDYAPAPEAKDHAKIKKQYDLFINGEFVKPNSKKYFSTYSPSTLEKLADVAEANEKDVGSILAPINE